MNKTFQRTLAVTVTAALLAISGVALADGGGGFFRMGKLLHGLKLTEAQEDQAITLRKEVMKEGKKARHNALESLDEVAVEVKKPQPDAKKLHQIADQRIDDLRKVEHFAIDRFLTFHQTLSPEQKAELAEKLEKSQRRAKKWESE